MFARSQRAVFACLTLVVLGCSPDEPHLARSSALVQGVVIDPIADRPIEGVRVRGRDCDCMDITDLEGRFELMLPEGSHELWLDRDGYVDGSHANVEVDEEGANAIEAYLFPNDPDDAAVAAYFARQPVRRHAHPAYERPSDAPVIEEDDVGSVSAAIHEPPTLPATIRVWRSSGTELEPTSGNGWADRSCDPLAEVIELPLEEYVKGVVPHEWLPSWHPEALRAGAIAARTFAVSWSVRGGRWACADLDDGTVTQVYRDTRSGTANEAVDATAGLVVMRDETIISTQYSAENSDPTATGVAEPTCTGTTLFGHGRGMCQWGTHRWALGICANAPCNFGELGSEPKDHLWMVEHYYPGATVVGAPVPPCGVIGPEGGILDDSGACFFAYGPSAYWREVTDGGYGGRLLWTNAWEASAPSNWALWRIHVSQPSTFRVEAYVDPTWGVYPLARYRITHAGGEAIVIVDQGTADGWVDLGVYEFIDQGRVALEDDYMGAVPPDQHLVADAIRLVPMDVVVPPPSDGGVGGETPYVGGTPREVHTGLVGCTAAASSRGAHPLSILAFVALVISAQTYRRRLARSRASEARSRSRARPPASVG